MCLSSLFVPNLFIGLFIGLFIYFFTGIPIIPEREWDTRIPLAILIARPFFTMSGSRLSGTGTMFLTR